MINEYLEFRAAFRSISRAPGLGNIYYPFGWGLETLDVQLQANGLGVEFTSEALPLLNDHKQYTARLIKSRLQSLKGASVEDINQHGTVTKGFSVVLFRFDPAWSDEELDRKIDELLERKINSFLSGPRLKPCVFGVHYQIDDVVRAVEKVLESN